MCLLCSVKVEDIDCDVIITACCFWNIKKYSRNKCHNVYSLDIFQSLPAKIFLLFRNEKEEEAACRLCVLTYIFYEKY